MVSEVTQRSNEQDFLLTTTTGMCNVPNLVCCKGKHCISLAVEPYFFPCSGKQLCVMVCVELVQFTCTCSSYNEFKVHLLIQPPRKSEQFAVIFSKF